MTIYALNHKLAQMPLLKSARDLKVNCHLVIKNAITDRIALEQRMTFIDYGKVFWKAIQESDTFGTNYSVSPLNLEELADLSQDADVIELQAIVAFVNNFIKSKPQNHTDFFLNFSFDLIDSKRGWHMVERSNVMPIKVNLP